MAFMDSLDSIREKATEAAQIAAKKTKKLAEIAKANLSIYAEEDKIKKAQTELGKLYYRDYVVGEDLDTAEYLPWCLKIDESKEAIADLRDYIDELKAEHVQEDLTFEDDLDMDEVAVYPDDFVVYPAEADCETEDETAAEEPEDPKDFED